MNIAVRNTKSIVPNVDETIKSRPLLRVCQMMNARLVLLINPSRVRLRLTHAPTAGTRSRRSLPSRVGTKLESSSLTKMSAICQGARGMQARTTGHKRSRYRQRVDN